MRKADRIPHAKDQRLYGRDHRGRFRDLSEFRSHPGAAQIPKPRRNPAKVEPVASVAKLAARVGHAAATAQGKQRRYEQIRDMSRHMTQDQGWRYKDAHREATLAVDQKLRRLRSR